MTAVSDVLAFCVNHFGFISALCNVVPSRQRLIPVNKMSFFCFVFQITISTIWGTFNKMVKHFQNQIIHLKSQKLTVLVFFIVISLLYSVGLNPNIFFALLQLVCFDFIYLLLAIELLNYDADDGKLKLDSFFMGTNLMIKVDSDQCLKQYNKYL